MSWLSMRGLRICALLEDLDEAAFDSSAINVKGPLFLTRSLLAFFANPASIVPTASINAHIGMPNTSVYGASKAAMLSFTKSLSGELLPRGIRVNAVSPVPIATQLYDKLGLDKARLEALRFTQGAGPGSPVRHPC